MIILLDLMVLTNISCWKVHIGEMISVKNRRRFFTSCLEMSQNFTIYHKMPGHTMAEYQGIHSSKNCQQNVHSHFAIRRSWYKIYSGIFDITILLCMVNKKEILTWKNCAKSSALNNTTSVCVGKRNHHIVTKLWLKEK